MLFESHHVTRDQFWLNHIYVSPNGQTKPSMNDESTTHHDYYDDLNSHNRTGETYQNYFSHNLLIIPFQNKQQTQILTEKF